MKYRNHLIFMPKFLKFVRILINFWNSWLILYRCLTEEGSTNLVQLSRFNLFPTIYFKGTAETTSIFVSRIALCQSMAEPNCKFTFDTWARDILKFSIRVSYANRLSIGKYQERRRRTFGGFHGLDTEKSFRLLFASRRKAIFGVNADENYSPSPYRNEIECRDEDELNELEPFFSQLALFPF